MPQKARQSDFYRTELDLNPEQIDVEFADGPIGKVLSHLLGRDRINNIWRQLALDFAGRVIVTQGVVNPIFRVGSQLAIASGNSSTIGANSARQVLFLQNIGVIPVFINFTGAATGNDLILPNDQVLRISGYQGAVTILNQGPSAATVNVLEA